jgi:hypothetical protein
VLEGSATINTGQSYYSDHDITLAAGAALAVEGEITFRATESALSVAAGATLTLGAGSKFHGTSLAAVVVEGVLVNPNYGDGAWGDESEVAFILKGDKVAAYSAGVLFVGPAASEAAISLSAGGEIRLEKDTITLAAGQATLNKSVYVSDNLVALAGADIIPGSAGYTLTVKNGFGFTYHGMVLVSAEENTSGTLFEYTDSAWAKAAE